MAIVETIVLTRPNTAVDFYSNTESMLLASWRASVQSLRDSGKFTTVKTLSDDELVQTMVNTYEDFTAWAEVKGTYTVAYDYERLQYASTNSITSTVNLVGLDAPFTGTTVYTFPSGTAVNSPLISSNERVYTSPYGSIVNLLDIVELRSVVDSGILQSLTSSDTTVTVVHSYADQDTYKNSKWSDQGFLDALVELGVTRTVAYALV